MKGKSFAIKRINKDIKEITKSPIEGIGIVSLSNDLMKYIVNIKLLEGPYKNYCVQLLLTVPDNYPTAPPKILIYPNQAIDGQYHHHIFPDSSQDEKGHHFKKFCFDLLENDFMSTKEENTGWNPSYTISSLLLQVQNFLCDPDMHGHIPPQNKIDELINSMDHYQRSFKIENDNGEEEIITHTWNKPYPEMFIKKEKEDNTDNIKTEEEKDKNDLRMQQIKDNLTCFMLKSNYIDDPDILLGYPIIQTKAEYGKDKIELYPIPELLTYDGLMAQIGKEDRKLDYYYDIKFKSANNKFYNYWIPIYIDENHYKKNKTAILNSLSVIKYGASGKKKHDFKPIHIFEILPILLNKMIIGIYNGKATISSSFIRCYFHYVLLFKKLCLEYEGEYSKYVNHILNLVKKNNFIINRQIIPDLGNFLMLLFFSNKDTHSENMKKIWYSLFEESSIRRPAWTFHGEEHILNIKKLIFKDEEPLIGDVYLKRFEKDDNYDMFDYELFIKDLAKANIFDRIVDFIFFDENVRKTLKYDSEIEDDMSETEQKKGLIRHLIASNFKNVYSLCTRETKYKMSELLIKKIKIQDYFGEMQEKEFKEYEELTEIRNELYDNCKVNELLKDESLENIDEIVKYIFENQKGNKLFIITFFTAKKIEDKEFMKELENNYGIYLDVDTFIKEMNQKLCEIKNHNEMYKYIGSEFGQHKTDLEIIIESYEKAKTKGYIREPKAKDFRGSNNKGRGNYSGNKGARGRGRGRGRGGR